MKNAYNEGLDKNPANYVPLSPLSHFKRCADIYGNYPAVIYGDIAYNWADIYERCQKLASALSKHGIGVGDTVSYIAANTPELFEAHFAIPMTGAVLNTINTRLDVDTIRYILQFGDCKVVFCDTQFSKILKSALDALGDAADEILVIDIVDEQAKMASGEGEKIGRYDYNDFMEMGDDSYQWQLPCDEWQALSLNFTSGTGGRPKGVVYHHRGSYLMAFGTAVGWQLPMHPKYLYTVPMFHCNGWGHAWTMALLAGCVVCCRVISAANIFGAINQHQITHFGAAPVVLGMLVNAREDEKKIFTHRIHAMTAGAPPAPAILEATAKLGITVMQVYGLTETYGHVVHCAWQDKWNDIPFQEQAERKAMQGVSFPMTEQVRVVDVETGVDVPHDGISMGEILVRGNTVMKGYYKNKEKTDAAFQGGWFHSEDLAVVDADGYIEVKDRLKDIIISGGENISSVEVEKVIYKHPSVLAAAIVAMKHDKWGEVPAAFIELKDGMTASENEIMDFCREYLAGFKCPKKIIFMELPKTATGKIQKFQLRDLVV